MPGVKGAGGPIPKRDGQRRRRNHPAGGPADSAFGAAEVDAPPAKRSWHPAALQWYESLAESGQAQFYEPSDWATAFLVAESMSRDLKPKVVATTMAGDVIKASVPISGASLSAYLKAMTGLMVTEGDRRRARLELERPAGGGEEGGGSVSWLAEARRGSAS